MRKGAFFLVFWLPIKFCLYLMDKWNPQMKFKVRQKSLSLKETLCWTIYDFLNAIEKRSYLWKKCTLFSTYESVWFIFFFVIIFLSFERIEHFIHYPKCMLSREIKKEWRFKIELSKFSKTQLQFESTSFWRYFNCSLHSTSIRQGISVCVSSQAENFFEGSSRIKSILWPYFGP